MLAQKVTTTSPKGNGTIHLLTLQASSEPLEPKTHKNTIEK